jgi:hypothetical protein
MAILISCATGDFDASGTWAENVDNSYINTHPASTTAQTVGTTNLVSSTFNGNSQSFDAILVKIASRAASPTGTVTVGYYDNSNNVVREVTVNVADIPADCKGWVAFKVVSTNASHSSGTIRIRTSSTGQLTVFGTSSTNWSRALRRDTALTLVPQASDTMIITGQLTGTGTSDTFTVTHNITATTTFGLLEVGHKGIWKWGTSASTNYYFKTSGNILLGSGSETYIGDNTTALPDTSTATIEIVPATNAAVGMFVLSNSTFITRTDYKPTPIAQLTADVAASGTSLTTDISTGWKNGQEIAIAGTNASNQYEFKALSADASGTTVTVNALTHAHTGTGDTRAHVGNLTRNIIIKGTSTSLNSYVVVTAVASGVVTTFDMEYVAFQNLGANVAQRYGVTIQAVSATTDIKMVGCVFRDFTVVGARFIRVEGTAIAKCLIQDCVGYNTASRFFDNAAQTNTSSELIMNNCLFIGSTLANDICIVWAAKNWQISNIFCWNNTSAGTYMIQAATVTTDYQQDGQFNYKWDNIQVHMITGAGLGIVRARRSRFGKLEFSKNNQNGALYFIGKDVIEIDDLKISTTVANGTGVRVQDIGTSLAKIGRYEFKGNSQAGTAAFVLLWNVSVEIDELICTNCASPFGVAGTYAGTLGQLKVNKTTFTSGVSDGGVSTNPNSYVKLGNYNGAGAFRHVYLYGTIRSDTTEFNTASPSVRMTPNSASNKLNGLEKYVAVANGNTATVKVWVKKSSAYNGSEVQVMLKKDAQAGITTDTQLAVSTSASNNAWEEVSSILPTATGDVVYTLYTTCDGTAGFVNLDDWSVT